MSWRVKACLWAIVIGLILLPLMSHAGGLGIAPLVAVIGGVGLLTSNPLDVRYVPNWVWALLALLIWCLVTSLWSPYEDTQTLTNPIKLLIGTCLYLGTLLTFRRATRPDRNFLRHIMIAVSVLSIGLLLIDILSGYALTFLVDPPKEGEDTLRKSGDTEMNLGHAITILALMMGPVMMMIRRQLTLGWMLAVVFAVFVALTALFGQLMIGLLAVLAAGFFMIAARYRPVLSFRVLIWIAILTIVLAPLAGWALGYVTPEMKAALPFSWEHRIEMWVYTADKVLASPLTGHGFDAVRTFDDTFSSRGIENWPIVSLHPHNAGLHIWAETGVIGAGLAATTIMLMGTAAEDFMRHSPLRARAACGFLAAAIVISNVTYGIWQDWWWASLILVAASLYLLPDQSRTENDRA